LLFIAIQVDFDSARRSGSARHADKLPPLVSGMVLPGFPGVFGA
jgi:hypothetical protein